MTALGQIDRNFRFISDDEDLLQIAKRSYKNYTVVAFHFEIITPKAGHKIARQINYPTPVRKDWFPIARILTLLVIKHSPAWFYEYVDTMPVKITKLIIHV